MPLSSVVESRSTAFEVLKNTALAATVLLSVGCTDARGPDTESVGASPVSEASHSTIGTDLGGTSWRLVAIRWMDDSTLAGEDSSPNTITFGEDGMATFETDCNRGGASWFADLSTGQLAFGPEMLSTLAECPPGAVGARLLDQLPWVRSYLISDRHLFLATMADGAIIEFEPAS